MVKDYVRDFLAQEYLPGSYNDELQKGITALRKRVDALIEAGNVMRVYAWPGDKKEWDKAVAKAKGDAKA